jgi:hypothetical protein
MLYFDFKNGEKGVSLLLSILVSAILLAIALGIATILVGQVRVLRGMENSVQAFFAADTGIERALYEGGSVSGVLPNGATYTVQLLLPGPECTAFSYCLRAVGIFRDARRAIEINR